MKRGIIGFLIVLSLAACTPPLSDGAYDGIPSVQVDTATANVGEPVNVTVTGSFIIAENYHKEEVVYTGVSLGACFWYATDRATTGGLCSDDGQSLIEGLSLLNGTTSAETFDSFTVRRGERRELRHTFTFTSDQPGEVVILPTYSFDGNLSSAPGPETVVQFGSR